jgi:uroporphyrinogen decarboxylase
MLHHIPLSHPKPDGKRFIDVLMGRARGTPPLVEYLVDDVLRKPITTDLLGRPWVEGVPADRAARTAWLDNFIAFWYRLGYDFVRYEEAMPFTRHSLLTADTAEGAHKQRAWADEHTALIASWQDFEAYPWPKPEQVDFYAYEYLNSHLPDGMGLICCHAGGMFEHLTYLMSLEGLCLAIHDAPDLVQAVAERLGRLMEGFYTHLLDLDRVIAIFPGDDMGFRSATTISPAALRSYTLPWHKRFAAMTHAKGLPYFLHSCGNLMQIMDTLIDDVRIDGKHSYEDAIIPVNEFQARFGDRIACLGGVDINILAAGTPDDVRRRTRWLMETCGGRGRYAVGSGNSIPSYIPLQNYLAMVDEGVGFRG